MKKNHFLLAASILFALVFTLSCSDDKGDWLTCQELFSLEMKCEKKYDAEYDACTTEACYDAVEAKMEKCFIGEACNGASERSCEKHYREEGCFDDNGGGDELVSCQIGADCYEPFPESQCYRNGGNVVSSCSSNPNPGDWLTCSAIDALVNHCRTTNNTESAFYQCMIHNGACPSGVSVLECESHYNDMCDDGGDDNGGNGGGDNNGGNWLTCNEVNTFIDVCYDRYEAETDACGYNDACWDDADDNYDKCLTDGICNGADEDTCWEYYYRKCDFY